MNPQVVRPLVFGPAAGMSAPPGRRRVRTPDVDRPAVLPLELPAGLVRDALTPVRADLPPRPGPPGGTLDDAVDDILRQASWISAVLSWLAGFVALAVLVLLLLR